MNDAEIEKAVGEIAMGTTITNVNDPKNKTQAALQAMNDHVAGIIPVSIKRLSAAAVIPQYAKPGDAGVDLVSLHDASLSPFQSTMIETGISIELPVGYEAQIRSRSGLAKKGIVVVNSPGTIDSGYRGPVNVLLINLSKPPPPESGNDGFFKIKKGDRIAQMVIAPVSQAKFVEVDELGDSERGAGGFGHTGMTDVRVHMTSEEDKRAMTKELLEKNTCGIVEEFENEIKEETGKGDIDHRDIRNKLNDEREERLSTISKRGRERLSEDELADIDASAGKKELLRRSMNNNDMKDAQKYLYEILISPARTKATEFGEELIDHLFSQDSASKELIKNEVEKLLDGKVTDDIFLVGTNSIKPTKRGKIHRTVLEMILDLRDETIASFVSGLDNALNMSRVIERYDGCATAGGKERKPVSQPRQSRSQTCFRGVKVAKVISREK